MEQMTEYERKRLENIKRNQQMFAALRVQNTAEDLRSASKKPKSEPNGLKLPKREREPGPTLLRRSLRTRRLSHQSIGDLGSDSPYAKPRNGFIAAGPRTPKPQKSSKKGPLSLAETYVHCGEEFSYDHFLNRIREHNERVPLADWICAKSGWGLEGGWHVGPASSPEDLKLEAKDIAEIAPSGILNVRILPCRERVIVVSGDKKGHLSIWDADCEEEGYGLHMYLLHAAPVTGIATEPFSVAKVLSCSCDGFIRCMDIEKEVFHMPYNNTDVMLSAIRCAPYNYQSVYFAEAGKIKVLDLRVGGVSNSYNLHEKRISSIDFHPESPQLMSTSSTDCMTSIWDVRKMGKKQTKSIATVRHDMAVLSAYFSPTGNYLATTSNDDNVVLLNGLDSWNKIMIYHHNPLWLCSFRAIWGWDDHYIFIGNIEKALDAICTSTKITSTLRSPLITSIPTALTKHPLLHGILAGATTGGQVYVWRKH